MKRTAALSLVEILITVSILGIVVFALVVSYTRSQANQSLRTSTEQLVNTLRQAHTFSRSSKDGVTWGVASKGNKNYELLKGPQSRPTVTVSTPLEAFVSLPENFSIWFEQGTGDIPADRVIKIQNNFGREVEILVTKNGIVEVPVE